MSYKEVAKILVKNGWRKKRQRGSHIIYEKDGMTFFGEYRSSLDTGEDWTDHAFYVHGISHEPVVATWNR